MPAGVLAVSESGITTAHDLRRLRGLGYQAFLIGERFMIEADPGRALNGLLQECKGPGEGLEPRAGGGL
jgi:indole-3-glycerol phosphate synthase